MNSVYASFIPRNDVQPNVCLNVILKRLLKRPRNNLLENNNPDYILIEKNKL